LQGFHKFDGASPDPWPQPATRDTPDGSRTSGTFAPLWTNQSPISPAAIYDGSFNVYLAAWHTRAGIEVRASSDLIHWSGPITAPYSVPGRKLGRTALIGGAGDATIRGPAPRRHFGAFPTPTFPDWKYAVFEGVPLAPSRGR
jgi:hypothetical protein